MHSPRSLVLPRLTFWAFPLYLVSLCLPGLPIRLWPFAACLLDPACLVISSLSAACPDLCIVPVADSALPTWHLLLPLTLACLTLPCCSIKLHLNLTPLTPHVTIAVITASTLIWGLFKKMWSVSVGILPIYPVEHLWCQTLRSGLCVGLSGSSTPNSIKQCFYGPWFVHWDIVMLPKVLPQSFKYSIVQNVLVFWSMKISLHWKQGT